MKLNKLVFILGSHKSGTSLMRNLLDEVRGLFAIPIETHFLEFAGFWIDYELRRNLPQERSFDEVKNLILNSINKSNETPGRFMRYGGDSILEDRWDIGAFEEHFEEKGRVAFDNGDVARFISAYMEAIYFSLMGETPPDLIRFVEKSVENAEYASYIKKLFPDAKFIHIIRNPYSTMVSIRKYMSLHGKFPFLGFACHALENNYHFAEINNLSVDDYHLIRYEDLLANPEVEMKKVADFIEMPFSEMMLAPTVLGRPWYGKSVSSGRFSEISKSSLFSWRKEITRLEVNLVNNYFDHVLEKYDYEKIIERKKAFYSNKKEWVANYLANRIFLLITEKRRKKLAIN